MGTMRLGDLLIRAKRVTEQDVEAALKRSQELGGRLGENLVAIGAIDQRTLSNFINRIPAEPADLAATGMDEADLIDLLLKLDLYAAAADGSALSGSDQTALSHCG